jgi:predicted glycosyltransferase
MRVLFDVSHPAHVHLYRQLAGRILTEGGAVLFAARDKDVTLRLLRAYGLPFESLSRARSRSRLRLAAELLQRTARLYARARAFRPDALVGSSSSVGLVGRLVGRPSYVFAEDDAKVTPLFAATAFPLATRIVTPRALAHENHGARHLMYPGYHELAYLHPNQFAPDPDLVRSLGLEPASPYFVVRLVALEAHHDTAAKGLSREAARRVVALLREHGRVLITSEAPLDPALEPLRFPLPPERFHDVLALAALVVGDSQTVSMEASVLGVPNFRCNTFVGRLSVLEELEHAFGLTRGFLPEAEGVLLTALADTLGRLDEVRRLHAERRRAMLERSVDLAVWQWDLLRADLGEGGRR